MPIAATARLTSPRSSASCAIRSSSRRRDGTDREPRILVVDDEANIRELLMQELTEAGYRVSTAANGREAIAAGAPRAARPRRSSTS